MKILCLNVQPEGIKKMRSSGVRPSVFTVDSVFVPNTSDDAREASLCEAEGCS